MELKFLWLLAFALGLSGVDCADRDTRQVQSSSYSPLDEDPTSATPANAYGWIPVTSAFATNDRGENARVLHYNFNPQVQQPLAAEPVEQSFIPQNIQQPQQQQQSQQPQQQSSFQFPYTYERFGFPQAEAQVAPKGHIQQISNAQPTSQSFFKFEMPLHHGGNSQEPAVQTGYQISHTFGSIPQSNFNAPLFTNKQVFPEFTPIQHNRKPQNIIEPPKQHTPKPKAAPQQQQISFKPYSPQLPQDNQEVQLLYVPYDALFNQPNENAVFQNKFNQQNENNVYQNKFSQQNENVVYQPNNNNNNNKLNYASQNVNPYQINSFYTPETLANQNQVYSTSTTPRTTTSPTTNPPRPTISTFLNPHPQTFYSTTSTEKNPKPKPKPHQPPLAMFVQKSGNRINYRDVVGILSQSSQIDVLDSPTESSPRVFIGPAGMPTPPGYKKFDLPYLSNLNHNIIENNFKDIPYFVAPLSYRNPSGFNKILLPEPHVGSIVVNRQFEPYQQPPPQQQQSFEVYQPTTPTPRNPPTTTHRLKATSPKEFYPEIMKEITGPRFEVSTQRFPIQQSTKQIFRWPGLDDQNTIPINQQTYKAPKIKQKTKRPEIIPVQTQKPFNNFKPMPNAIVEDIYKVQPIRTPLTDPVTTSTTTTSTTSTQPPRYYTQTNPTTAQVDIQSMKGQLYHNVDTLNSYVQKSTPPTVGVTKEEEFRMKQYFRQQDAFRHRPQVSVTQSPVYHNIQYTPVSVDYDQEVRIPSSTPTTYSTTPKERYTFYHPNPTTSIFDQELNTVTPQEDVVEFSRDPEKYTEKPKSTTLLRIPQNHRPTYSNNEIQENEKSHELEFEPNPYQLPSELPPLTPNLPEMTGQQEYETTTPITVRPTRRPLQRTRKPTANSVSSSSNESSSRRPIARRRPLASRNYTSPAATTSNTYPLSSPTRIPAVRNPNRVRYNPSNEERQAFHIKSRKQATEKRQHQTAERSEDLDYQRDVLKQNYPIIKPASSRYPVQSEQIPSTNPNLQNTEYVEKQNQSPSEAVNDVYTVTPVSSNVVSSDFPSILEPMEIAQQFQEFSKENFGPGYFPQEEQSESTEAVVRNEIQPAIITTPKYQSTTTSTEDPVAITSRRPVFVRRPYRPRVTTTTTEPSIVTTTLSSEERFTIRSRNTPRKVVKIRPRLKRPLAQHPASTSTTEGAGRDVGERRSYFPKTRYNPDIYQDEQQTETPKRLRVKSRYNNNNLDAQESQWSPAQSVRSNNFQPVSEKVSKEKTSFQIDNSQEIVTADPENSQSQETVLYKVSAGFGSTGTGNGGQMKTAEKKNDQGVPDILMVEATTKKSDDQSAFESHKTENKFGTHNRQSGFWRKFRVRPQPTPSETIETSESQNIGQHLINALKKEEKVERKATPITTTMIPQLSEEVIETTIAPPVEVLEVRTQAPTTTTTTTTTTTVSTPTMKPSAPTSKAYAFNHKPYFQEIYPSPQPTVLTSSEQVVLNTPDSITKRIDDETVLDSLEKDQSIFADVKRQLTDLFAAETSDYEEHASKPKEYMSIQRARSITDAPITTTDSSSEEQILSTINNEKGFHKKLMDSVVYATSTSKQMEVSQDTEICYRGKCIKAAKTA